MSSTESVYLSLEAVLHYVQNEEMSQGVKFVTQTKSADFGSDGKMQLMVYTKTRPGGRHCAMAAAAKCSGSNSLKTRPAPKVQKIRPTYILLLVIFSRLTGVRVSATGVRLHHCSHCNSPIKRNPNA